MGRTLPFVAFYLPHYHVYCLTCLHAEMLNKPYLKKEMATHSSILAWEISWTEEPGGLQFMGRKRWAQLKY